MNGAIATRVWHLALAAGVAWLLAACSERPPCTLCPAIDQRDPQALQGLLARGEPVTVAALEHAFDPNLLTVRLRGDAPGATDRRIAELLIDAGDVNSQWTVVLLSGGGGSARSTTGRSGSSWQFKRTLAGAVIETWPDAAMVARLLQRGLDVRGAAGGEALRSAAAAGGRTAVQALLAAGAPVNHVGADKLRPTTALAEAIQRRDLAVIADLEAAGALEWPDD